MSIVKWTPDQSSSFAQNLWINEDASSPLIPSKPENGWDSIKEQGEEIFGSEHITEAIEQSVIKDYCEKNKLSRATLTSDGKEAILRANVTSLFKKLAEEFAGSADFKNLGKLIEECENKNFITICNGALLGDDGKTVRIEKTEDLAVIKERLKRLPPIGFLDLNNFSDIKTIPSELRNFSKLTTLKLNYNDIKYIPRSISSLIFLENLHLCNNQIRFVPGFIGSCENLKKLVLSNNKIEGIANGLSNLTNLSELNLYNNKLTHIPGCLRSLKQLNNLEVRENPLIILFNNRELTNDTVQYLISKSVELNEYQCRGTLSSFLKKILEYIDYPDILKRNFDRLDNKYKNLIVKEYIRIHLNEKDKNEINEKLCDFVEKKPFSFCCVVYHTIVNTYLKLPENQQQLVQEKFKNLFKLPEYAKDYSEEVKQYIQDTHYQCKPDYNVFHLGDVLEEMNLYSEVENYLELRDGLNPPKVTKPQANKDETCILF